MCRDEGRTEIRGFQQKMKITRLSGPSSSTNLAALEDLQRPILKHSANIVPCCIMDMNALSLKEKLHEIVGAILKKCCETILMEMTKNNETNHTHVQTLTELVEKSTTNVEELFEVLAEKDAATPSCRGWSTRSRVALRRWS
jgi:hypothetical protein